MIQAERREIDLMAAVEDRLWWYVGMRTMARALLDRHLGPRRDLRILDAGCGTGANVRFLSAWGDVQGIDWDRYALSRARSVRDGQHHRSLAQADTCRLPFAGATFDLVTSFDVLPMLPLGSDRAALSELSRVTRPSGWVLIRVAAHDWLRGAHDRFWRNSHRYHLKELRGRIESAELSVAHIGYLNSWLFPFVAVKRLCEPLFPTQGHSDLAVTPGWLNRSLTRLLTSETGPFLRGWLPAGLSLMALAQRKRE